jgi:5-methylcytosine-specific restriction endonuclease McrA
MKLYKCEFQGCETVTKIRTTIKDKDSEFYGLRVCSFHASQLRPRTVSDKTRRTQQARAEQRKDYPEFYQRHIEIAVKKKCENCNTKLTGSSTEICHILGKAENPEIATEDQNILYLCWECHNKFDKSGTSRQGMSVYSTAQDRLKLIESKIIKKSAQYFWMFP